MANIGTLVRRRSLLQSLIFAMALWGGPGGAREAVAQSQPTEEQLKAAFLYNFAKFVDWPPRAFADATTPFTIGVIGDDSFGSILDETVKGKTVNGRRLAIKRLQRNQDLTGCHILFISRSEKKHLEEIIKRINGSNVLTVGAMERFAELGGIINFRVIDDKLRFEINVDTAERSGLKINSKLLTLATIVRGDPRGGKG